MYSAGLVLFLEKNRFRELEGDSSSTENKLYIQPCQAWDGLLRQLILHELFIYKIDSTVLGYYLRVEQEVSLTYIEAMTEAIMDMNQTPQTQPAVSIGIQ